MPLLALPQNGAPAEDVVHREAMEPRPELGLALERGELAPRADEHFLREVVRFSRSRESHRERVDAAHVPAIQTLEGALIAGRGPRHIRSLEVFWHPLDQGPPSGSR